MTPDLFGSKRARSFSSPGIACGFLILAAASGTAGGDFVTFDQRENLNVLNSPDVSITASHFEASNNDSGNDLRGTAAESSSSGIGWFSGTMNVPDKEVFTIDLGATRNVQTFRLFGPRNFTAATIETFDGVNWSGNLAHSTTVVGNETVFVLNTPVNSDMLRITGDSYSFDNGSTRSIGFGNLRIYGAPGAVTADQGLDLVASSAWTGGNATISQNGGNFVPATALTDMADDNHADLGSRQLVYDLGTGDNVTVTFAETVTAIGRVGVTMTTTLDTGTRFQFLGSTDGTNFNTVLLDQTGTLTVGTNFFDLATPYTGTAVRFNIVSSSSTDNRVVDMFVFQDASNVPEPAAIGLIGLAGATLAGRRRGAKR